MKYIHIRGPYFIPDCTKDNRANGLILLSEFVIIKEYQINDESSLYRSDSGRNQRLGFVLFSRSAVKRFIASFFM
jgi:hypothetical protein